MDRNYNIIDYLAIIRRLVNVYDMYGSRGLEGPKWSIERLHEAFNNWDLYYIFINDWSNYHEY